MGRRYSKTLVLIRHAHRDKSRGRHLDNGISERGREQADRIFQYFHDKHSQSKPCVVSSPKKRCIETVKPIAKFFSTGVTQDPLLDEQSEEESDKQFEKRTKNFLKWWKKKAPVMTVACSHGDSIPLLLDLTVGHSIDLAKGGIVELGLDDEEPELRCLIGSIDFWTR